MATLSTTASSLPSTRFSSSSSSSSSSSLAFCTFPFQSPNPFVALKAHTSKNRRLCVTKAVEEETQQQVQQEEEEATTEQQPVVVPVSPSDTLTMFFQTKCVAFHTFEGRGNNE